MAGLVKKYLFLYNIVQFGGWTYILYLLAAHFHAGGWSSQSLIGVWQHVGWWVTLFQFGAVLEIVHSLVGFVKTPVATTFVQVFSRVACVTLAILVPTTNDHWAMSLMLTAWGITEVVRYLFYALSLYDAVPYILGWLRYTLFIILYPSGVTGETGTIIASLPYVKETGLWSITMPNALNVSFNLYYTLIGSLAFYVIGLPWLYTYMLGQRKRFIQSGGVTKKPATSSVTSSPSSAKKQN
ncbi:hypothetical protein DFA_06437 [Cavenderia fasciculata]|uniref:very-long-chain (3R)-3-hydroxyacyl-CoA dehydratase n=1 Tax=Cavenderia fasciculata TaxID=261658 RepID=F4PJ01_CACFS|nr:uncharacterized protein DFA_06437 [Cavenderia fasciculata]EGG24287.1 hypothetical protein DFA_06437 [Cavenderia fasciculata]|eukprot:XP_004362138.1 hypothetical protein DFA_06437 [Cavenderia fasciculata]